MVPGMTERELRAADMQRLEWLADSVLGPATPRAGPLVPSGSRYALPLAFTRNGIAMARRFGHRVRLTLPWPARTVPRRAPRRASA
jgi:hypothetical protein